jgi:hypothetical protein
VPTLLLAVFLAAFSASALRHADPDLKERTRSASSRTVERAHAPVVRPEVFVAPGGEGAPVVVETTRRAARFVPFPRPPFHVARPNARAPGADALGTGSVPRSRRWAVLGGHGRHGAG